MDTNAVKYASQPRTTGLVPRARSSRVLVVSRSGRQARTRRLICVSLALLTPGRKPVKASAVFLLKALRGRNVKPRNVNDVFSYVPRRLLSLQYTSRVLSGCSSSPTSASRRAIAACTRAFIDEPRHSYSVPYPLAHHQPYVSARHLILEAQEAAGLSPEFCLVAYAGGQLILTPPSQSFVERVTWEGDLAAAWRPHDDPHSPVLMAPDVRFGRPAIKGISTDVIREHDEAGEDVDEIAEAFAG